MKADFLVTLAATGTLLVLAACGTAGSTSPGDASATGKKSGTPDIIREQRDGRYGGGHGRG